MDTHAQSALLQQTKTSIAGLVIMMGVVIGAMVFVPGLASAALHAQIQTWSLPAGRANCTYSAKQTPRLSGAVISGNLRDSCQGMPTMNGTSKDAWVAEGTFTSTLPRTAFPV